ncbi:MAG: MAE_28990/MAE_18760 family HEPN-like nuclease [Bryobacteraceae bacterium]
MDWLTSLFEDRVREIDTYLDFLEGLDRAVRDETGVLLGSRVTPEQQRILHSSVYLQLYNLVEATVTWCLEAVQTAARDGWLPADLSNELRRQWIRSIARTHVELHHERRLDCAVTLSEWLIQQRPLGDWTLERGNAGNWDENSIQEMMSRLGFSDTIPRAVVSAVKRRMREDKGSLALVKDRRNRLAHGSLSFSECGAEDSVTDLRELRNRTIDYLREVVQSFRSQITAHQFLLPERRPSPNAPQ